MISEKQKDRIATVAIRGGGILVILAVVAIVVNIGLEALPLFRPAGAGELEVLTSDLSPLAVGGDPRGEMVWALNRDGTVVFPGDGSRDGIAVAPGPLSAADHEIHGLITLIDGEGALRVGRLRFRDDWRDGLRSTAASWRDAAEPLVLPPGTRWTGVTANSDGDGNLIAVAWGDSGDPLVARWEAEDEQWELTSGRFSRGSIATAAVAEDLGHAAVVGRDGRLQIFNLPDGSAVALEGIRGRVVAVRFLIGGGSLVAVGGDGEVDVLLRVPRVEVINGTRRPLDVVGEVIRSGERRVVDDDQVGRRLSGTRDVEVSAAAPVWRVVRSLPGMSAPPTVVAPGHRRRDFLVGAEDGTVGLYYSTSGRRLLSDRWAEGPVDLLALDPKGDGVVVAAGGRILRRSVDNPHPEVSLKALFLPVWYEGYGAPKWVWQTTGGSDGFEPKMSLWPLIFGTLKATLYAMLFSVPLALLAAIYVSQLAPAWLQSVVKPTVELMAAVPSVVVGFLAALWLAPRLEQALFPSLLGLLALPFAVIAALAGWRLTPGRWRRRMPAGGELLLLLGAGAVVVVVVTWIAGPLESRWFDGDFQRFLFTEWGIRYDQRNSMVVGIALGFAVIPVIFTIAEDACSSVPRSLVTASRALGATRWQTAVKLVVPAASPGLFAAVMLGLGRAVGETMIVLMAAGNTPLLDLSLFNGMRTMSAAIAVEIPEAPVGSTLFRVLFLTGALLFTFTLVLTTAADLVGDYLRKRYARF